MQKGRIALRGFSLCVVSLPTDESGQGERLKSLEKAPTPNNLETRSREISDRKVPLTDRTDQAASRARENVTGGQLEPY